MVTLMTGSGSDCGMDGSGKIHITVDGMNHEHCETPNFNNPGNDFEAGGIDIYTGDALGECMTTDFTKGLFQFTVQHSGSDGWCFAEAVVEMRDGTVVDCMANVFLDNSEQFVCPA